MQEVLAFAAVAAVVTVTPGASTALVLRSALRGGTRAAIRTIAGNETGVLAWALLSVLGLSALVAASEVAYDVLRVLGAAVLVALGVQALSRSRQDFELPQAHDPGRGAYRDGVITSLANPKLSVFFIALLPQFVPAGSSVPALTLAMAITLILFDFAWFLLLAALVGRAQRILRGRAGRWIERLSGTVLVGLGARMALAAR